MELSEKILLHQRRLNFLNSVMASFIQVGDLKEMERTQVDVDICKSKLEELLKEQEDANREPELPMD
jgi:hypothetical protein